MQNIIVALSRFLSSHKKLIILIIAVVVLLTVIIFYYFPHIFVEVTFRKSRYPQVYAKLLTRIINYPASNISDISKEIYIFGNLTFRLPTNNTVEEINFNENAEIIQLLASSTLPAMKQFKFDNKKALFVLEKLPSKLEQIEAVVLESQKPIVQGQALSWLFGENNLKSDYLLQKYLFGINPDQVNLFTSRDEAIKKTILLTYRLVLLNPLEKNVIYNFQTPYIKGFQFGNPTGTGGVSIEFYDNDEKRYILGVYQLNQDEIDIILSSIKSTSHN